MLLYHYKLKHGYEEAFPSLPFKLCIVSSSHDKAERVINEMGVEAKLYVVFTITKINFK